MSNKEKHLFHRKDEFVDLPQTAKQSESQQARLQNSFQWDDDLESEQKDDLPPLVAEAAAIEQCISFLSNRLLSSLSAESLQTIDTAIILSVPVVETEHPLLQSRFDERFSLDSRLGVFALLQDRLSSEFDQPEKRQELDEKIKALLPPSRKSFVSQDVLLCDDAFSVDDQANSLSIEVTTQFASAK